MSRNVVLSPHARLKLQTLDPEEARRVVEAVARLVQDPTSSAMRRLPERDETFVCRVGIFEVVAKLEGSTAIVLTLLPEQLVREYREHAA